MQSASERVARPSGASRVRARQIVLALALLWIVVPRLGAIIAFFFGATLAVIRFTSLVGGLVAAVPLSALIVVALVRFERIERVYWFLPLYFLASGLGSFISGLRLEHPGGLLLAVFGPSLGYLPQLLIGFGLWAFRPRPGNP